jgi:hypothetical protein
VLKTLEMVRTRIAERTDSAGDARIDDRSTFPLAAQNCGSY